MADSGRRTILWVGLAVFAVVAILAAVGVVVDSGDDGGGASDETLSATGAAAGCGSVEKARPVPPGGKHRAGTIAYDEAPPHSGEHAPNTLRNLTRFYSREDPPAAEQAVHNLEHGLVVAWYDNDLPDDQVAILMEASQGMGSRYVAVPWTRSTFEGGGHFALTAWGVRQYCERVSAEHITAFIDAHADTDAPEKGFNV